MKFDDKLIKLRKETGATQQEVAAAIGVSRRTYIGYEKENRYPKSRDTYKLLAAYFGVDINYLLSEGDLPSDKGPDKLSAFITRAAGFFYNEKIDQETKDECIEAMWEVYFKSKVC